MKIGHEKRINGKQHNNKVNKVLKILAKLLAVLLIVQLVGGFLFLPSKINQAKAAGTTYYVANTGNDSCDGTSQTIGSSGSCAWKTIAKVNSSSFLPGDSILFNRGDTWREQLTVPSSGSAGSPIVFGAYGSGNRPVINGSDVVLSWTDNSGSSENEGTTTTGTTFQPTNTLFFNQVTSINGGVLQSFHIYFGASYPTHVKMALYTDSGDYPGTLLANSESTAIVPVAGWNAAAVSNGMTVGASTKYWIAYWMDRWADNAPVDSSNNGIPAYRLVTAYGSWPANGNGASSWSNNGSGFYAVVGAVGTPNTWKATVTTQPYAVWFNSTLGNLKANVALLGATGDWYWLSNTLYVYSTSDPTTAYNNPGIESANRRTAYISDKTYITFDNIKFDKGGNADNGGDSIALRQSQNIIVQNCDVTDSVNLGVAIYNIDGTTGDTLIQYCTFRGSGESKSASGAPSGIQTYNTGDTPAFTVQYNTFQDMDAWGAHHGHAIYHQSGKLIWRYNYHYGDRGSTQAGGGAGAAVRLHSTGGANVYNNIFSNNGGRRYWGVLPDAGTNNIYNNVFYENNYGIRAEGGTNVVKNNILFGTSVNTWYYVYDTNGSYSGDHNIYYGAGNGWVWNGGSDITSFASWKTVSGKDTSSLDSDPKFTNAVGNNFNLESTSPAINAGVDVGLTTDYAGNSVPKCSNSNPDIGAYEYQYDCPVTGGASVPGYSNPPIPGINGFKCIINNGDTTTKTRNVTLTLEAGDNVRYYSVSEKPDLKGAGFDVFEPEAINKPFALSSGDGLKTVYAQFMTAYNRLSDIVSDDIVLATSIQSTQPVKPTQPIEQPVVSQNPNITDGDLIKTANSPDVYIVKLIPAGAGQAAKKYKRLILNPDIFNQYKHLKWENIKTVIQEVLDQYTASDLVRAFGDTKAYKLFANGDIGEKRWIRTLNDFISFGYDWDSVYTINNYERNSYVPGLDLTSSQQ